MDKPKKPRMTKKQLHKETCVQILSNISTIDLKIKLLKWIMSDFDTQYESELFKHSNLLYLTLVDKRHKLWMYYMSVAQLIPSEHDVRAKHIAFRAMLCKQDRFGRQLSSIAQAEKFSPNEIVQILDIPYCFNEIYGSKYDDTKEAVIQSIIDEGEEIEFMEAVRLRAERDAAKDLNTENAETESDEAEE